MEAAEIIDKKIKPYYKNGNHVLWNLHNLDILDKHRLLIPVIQKSTITLFDPPNIRNEEFINYVFEHISKYRDSDPSKPINIRGGEFKIQERGVPEIELMFHSDSPFANQNVFEVLEECIEEIQKVMKTFINEGC